MCAFPGCSAHSARVDGAGGSNACGSWTVLWDLISVNVRFACKDRSSGDYSRARDGPTQIDARAARK